MTHERSKDAKGDESRRRGPESPATVFVVEGPVAIRELVVGFLQRLDGFTVAGSSGAREEAERECARLQPDVALVDWIHLPDTSSDNLAEAIRKRCPATRVVVFAASAEAHFVSDAIAAGVSGFAVRNAPLESLAVALRTVMQGRQYFAPETAGVLRDLLRRSTTSAGPAGRLSHREKEVLREIAQGHPSKEIAATFNLSVYTVENIRRRIMRKTRLKSVAELTLHAVRLHLIPTPNGAPPGGDHPG